MPVEILTPGGAGASGLSSPVDPTQGGTGTTAQFTPGSIVYAGAAGVYSQDNAKLFHDATGNKNGFGTNIPSVTLEVADVTVLAAESLTNPNLTGGASWSATGDMALAVDAATYTHATGVGTLAQASGTLAIAGVANDLYSFTYTISNLSAFVNIPIVMITTGFASTAVPLVINQAGVYTVIFRSAAVPGNFVLNVTSASAGAFTMDTFILEHVIGGGLRVNGDARVNGTATATAFSGPLTGNVTGNASGTAATVTGAAQTAITSVGTLTGGATGAGFTLALTTSTVTGTLADARLSSNVPLRNAANSFSLINPLTTIAESWIGPSSTTGVYFKGGNVGVGATGPVTNLEGQGAASADPVSLGSAPNGVFGVSTAPGGMLNVGLGDTGGTYIWMQGRSRGSGGGGTTYPIALQPLGGLFGIGIRPTSQLHTTGTVTMANFGAGAATFDASGNVTSVSDERLKDIQGQFKAGLAEVLKLSPILYKWNAASKMETEHTYAGFSAQNVQAAIPEAVGEDKDGYLSLQDRALLAACVNAIKELNDKIGKLVG